MNFHSFRECREGPLLKVNFTFSKDWNCFTPLKGELSLHQRVKKCPYLEIWNMFKTFPVWTRTFITTGVSKTFKVKPGNYKKIDFKFSFGYIYSNGEIRNCLKQEKKKRLMQVWNRHIARLVKQQINSLIETQATLLY